MSQTHPIVDALKLLLDNRADLKQALENAITKANLPKWFHDLPSFYDFIGKQVVQIPENSNAMANMDLAYFYVLDVSEDEILVNDPEFRQWNLDFNNAWADFLDTEKSRAHLDSYIKDPNFRIDDYQVAPSGWHSFNQFFARETKPGKRPIANHCDPGTVVSPADCQIKDVRTIAADDTIEVKKAHLKISELMADSQYADAFEGGLLMSAYLQMYDYHRMHVPAAGKVLEAKKIPGTVGLQIEAEGDMLIPIPQLGFQFTQDRGLLVLETDAMGLVALIPVGMVQISSVVLTAEVGVELYKGEEFGYFQFGGSNIIMLTQKDRFELDITASHMKWLQGVQIGKALPAK
ncbi:MAG: phosphatidylserine decarboxylase [Pseudomonadota bacterium]